MKFQQNDCGKDQKFNWLNYRININVLGFIVYMWLFPGAYAEANPINTIDMYSMLGVKINICDNVYKELEDELASNTGPFGKLEKMSDDYYYAVDIENIAGDCVESMMSINYTGNGRKTLLIMLSMVFGYDENRAGTEDLIRKYHATSVDENNIVEMLESLGSILVDWKADDIENFYYCKNYLVDLDINGSQNIDLCGSQFIKYYTQYR